MYINEWIYYTSLEEKRGSVKHLEILWEVKSYIIFIVKKLLIISFPCFDILYEF